MRTEKTHTALYNLVLRLKPPYSKSASHLLPSLHHPSTSETATCSLLCGNYRVHLCSICVLKGTWLDSITASMHLSLSKPQEIVKDKEAWHAQSMGLQRVGYDLATEKQQLHRGCAGVTSLDLLRG